MQVTDKLKELFPGPTADQKNIDQGERIVPLLAGSWLLYKSIKKMGKHPLLGFQGICRLN